MQVKTILASKTKKFWKFENNKDTGVCDQTTYSVTLQCWLLSSSTIRYSKTLYIQTPKWNKESLKLAYGKWLENLVMGNLILNELPGGLLAGFYCWYHCIVYKCIQLKNTQSWNSDLCYSSKPSSSLGFPSFLFCPFALSILFQMIVCLIPLKNFQLFSLG